jgi:predicted dehydrogenase
MKAMKEAVKVGVVGCGYWGPNLVRNLRQSPDCQLKLICDTNEQRLSHMRRLYPEVATTRRFEDLLNGADLDAVVIATPVRFHHEMAMAALRAGKHVFIEKPMARTEAEAEEIVELAEREGLVVMVGHTFLFSPAVRRMKEIVDAGDIGEVQYIAARRLNLGLFQKDINVAWDLAPHDISIILYVLGEVPTGVNCQGRAHVVHGIEDVTNLTLAFSSGTFATIQSSWLDPNKVREITFVGDKQMLVYDDMEPLEKIKIYDKRVEVPPHYDSFAEFQYSYHYGDVYSPYVKQVESLRFECQHFVDCIAGGVACDSDGVQGMAVVGILEAASASLRNGGGRVDVTSPTAVPVQ